MANNFNLNEFCTGVYYRPIQEGLHQVTLGKISLVNDTKENGEDASYLNVPVTFVDNERKLDLRFYATGAKIFCDQLRMQLNDTNDYENPLVFLETVTNQVLCMWVSKRNYLDTKENKYKTTLQYDFVAPVVVENAEDDELPC